MTRYRDQLPQMSGKLYLTDGGIETTMIFQEGLALPDFAAFDLFRTAAGAAALGKYFRTYAALARKFGTGFILESATWRASADWGARLGYSPDALADANRSAIALLEEIRSECEEPARPMVISGCVGPRGDGYTPGKTMSVGEAEAYHGEQIATFALTAVDMITAITMNYVEEAEGVARAARRARLPVAISFTVETDGKLPTGQTLQDAIEQVEHATATYPSYYMINCAHPSHFAPVLSPAFPWTSRIRGIRANASAQSHAELNESPELDSGNPEELGRQYRELLALLPNVNVMGGCCGTDHRHVEQMALACASRFS